jgi:hypothetical protein
VIRRWLPLAAGIVGTLVLAIGVGAGVQTALAVGQPTPRLRTVPPATLARLDISLGPATEMPYCSLQGLPLLGRLVTARPLGCPISRGQAIAAARGPVSRTVIETLLARVTAPNQPAIGQDRLAWLVVLGGWRPPPIPPACAACALSPGSSTIRPILLPIMVAPSLVVVDAVTDRVLATFGLGNPIPFPIAGKPAPHMGVSVPWTRSLPGTVVEPMVPAGSPSSG